MSRRFSKLDPWFGRIGTVVTVTAGNIFHRTNR